MSIEPTFQGDTIYQGAAHIVINKSATPLVKSAWKYLYAAGEVQVRLVRPEREVAVAGFGAVATPATDETVEVTFTPASRIDATILAYLYGDILGKMPGASWFGSSDHPVWIHTVAGRIMGVSNCRPTVFPALNFGLPPQRFGGAVTLTGVVKRGVARTAENALFTPWADEAFEAWPDEDDFPAAPCSFEWAAKAGTPLEGMEGISFAPQVQLTPRALANLGTVDFTVASVGVEVSCVPANLLEADLWGQYVYPASRALGTQVAGGDITITEDYPGLVATVANARLVQAPTRFDPANPVAGQCVWRSRRKAVTVGEVTSWSPAGTLAMAAAPAP